MAGQTKQRRWTKKALKHLEDNGLHPTDVQYGDGYFIFPHGKDMIVHFHIKECKGWRFGIWWNIEGEVEFDFFAQYERDIDKFKPAASTLVIERVTLADWSLDEIVTMCRFIKRHPYRAWMADTRYRGKIWNWELLNGCFVKYWKAWWELSVADPWVHKKAYKKYLKLVQRIVDSCLVNPRIKDNNEGGWRCSPRYEVVCDGFINDDVEKSGTYSIDFSEDLPPALHEEVRQYQKWHDKQVNVGHHALHDVWLGDKLPVFVKKDKGGRWK